MKREIICGDALEVLKRLPDQSIHCCVTSPPYWSLRDYGVEGQVGLEESPERYVESIVDVFREVKRVLRDEGTVWLNLGDSYAGSGRMGSFVDSKAKKGMKIIKDYHRNKPIEGLKPKDLCGIPWRVAFALQADGWWLRSDIIWSKPNPMPESVRDRPTKAHEYIFLLSKSKKYYYDYEAIAERSVSAGETRGGGVKYSNREVDNGIGGHHNLDKYGVTLQFRNKRDVWTVATKPFKEAHFAVFPPDLIRPCVLAGCPPGGIVLDPFFGAGTTGLVAKQERRGYIGIELNPEYVEMARARIRRECPMERLI